VIGINYRRAHHCSLLLITIHHYWANRLLIVGIIWFPEPPKEALKNPSNAQWSPDAASDLIWLQQ
jgi:hypothetical protein